MTYTILTTKELANIMDITSIHLSKIIRDDKDFPVIRIFTTKRFIKEKVLDYLNIKKKIDCVPMHRQVNLIMEVK